MLLEGDSLRHWRASVVSHSGSNARQGARVSPRCVASQLAFVSVPAVQLL